MSTAFHDLSLPAQGRAFGTAKLHGFLEGRPDDRPPLVLLHGLTFDHRMWLPAMAALRVRDPERQVLVLDLPGHGGSALLPRCDPEDVAAAVAAAVEDAGLDRPVVVGHSIAAIIATAFAVTYPSRGVVNVDQPLDTSFIGLLQANREMVAGPGFAQLWPAILASMHIEDLPERAWRLLRTELPRQEVVLAYWRQALHWPMADMEARVAEVAGQFRRLQLPYAVIAGHPWDQAETQRMREALPQATLTVVPNSGHFPHLADPDRFAQALAETGRSAPGPRGEPLGRDHRRQPLPQRGPGPIAEDGFGQ
jgi:pimeloyl-ACP methyl ester carboxylesterase